MVTDLLPGQFVITCLDCGSEFRAFRVNYPNSPNIPFGCTYAKTIRNCPTCQISGSIRVAVLSDLYSDAIPLLHFPPVINPHGGVRHGNIHEPCCDNPRRNMAGGCDNCGDPCL